MIRINDPNIIVIVFGEHALNTLGQIRCFGEMGKKPDVIWFLGDLLVPSNSKYINHFHKVKSFEDGLKYILDNYNDSDKRYIISTDSDSVVSLLDLHYNELQDRFVFFNAAHQGRLTQFMPKDVQCQLAEKHGLNVPKSELVKKGLLPQHLNYPVLTKTNDCFTKNWKNNYVICNSESELIEAYTRISNEVILLQEFVEKVNEVAIEGISINKGDEVYIPVQGEYLRIEPGNYGSWKRNELYNLGEELKNSIQAILKEVRYSGVFEVEFLKDAHGKLFFLEINFRHTQYNHALSDMGVNLCKVFTESMLNNRLCIEDIHHIKSPHIVMNERRDYETYVKTKRISIKNWISDIRKSDSFYLFDKKDKRPFIDYYLDEIKGFLLKYAYMLRIKR